jgi:putative ABC transport system substrate-binding protein
MEKLYLRRIYWQLTGVITVAMVLTLAALSFITQRAFEQELVPEMARKAQTVGASVNALLTRAMSYGIAFHSLYGVDQTLDNVLGENPDFAYLAVTDAKGAILHQAGTSPAGAAEHFADAQVLAGVAQPRPASAPALVGDAYFVSMPVHAGENTVGVLHIGVAQRFVQKIMLEVVLDVVVVLLVAFFFTLELLHFAAGARLAVGMGDFATAIERMRTGDLRLRREPRTGDEIGQVLGLIDAKLVQLNDAYMKLGAKARALIDQRFRFGIADAQSTDNESAIARIRAPLFAFILAEELTRTFLPSFVNKLLVPVPGLSPQIVIGLPIVLFMLIVAIGQPFLGAWSERIGRRRAMLIGAVVSTVGFIATAAAQGLYDLLLWRSLCGIGYAIVFVAAQGYILDHVRPQNRAQGFALFVGAIMVATICGPAIGGILADNIGYRLSFGVSAALCLVSLVAIRMMPASSGLPDRRPERPPKLSDFGHLLLNSKFMTLTALAAVPAKIILTGFCFYLVPLYIVSIGSTQAMAGRMLMVYAVMMVLIVPLAAKFADQGARREHLVAAGLLVSGLGGLFLLGSSDFLAIFLVVLLLGLGQALSIASQSALVSDLCHAEIARYGDGSVYGAYRMLERLGNAVGPLIAGILVVHYDYQGAFVFISIGVLVCGVLFALLTAWRRTPNVNAAKGLLAVLVPLAMMLASSDASAAQAPTSDAKPFRIYAITFRGMTDVEKGFQDYFVSRGIPVQITFRDLARDASRMPGFLDEIRREKPDLVYTWGTSVTLGVVGPFDAVDPKVHITDIPVVFTLVAAPVSAKIVARLKAPGRNVTGVSHVVPTETQVHAMGSYRPFKTLGVLYTPSEQNSVVILKELQDLGARKGFTVVAKPFRLDAAKKVTGEGAADLVREIKQARSDWLYLPPDSFLGTLAQKVVIPAATEAGLPTFASTEQLMESGALAGLVSRYHSIGQFTAYKAEQILLRKQRPGDIPVETLTRFSLQIRLPVAERLKLLPPLPMFNYAEIMTDEVEAK